MIINQQINKFKILTKIINNSQINKIIKSAIKYRTMVMNKLSKMRIYNNYKKTTFNKIIVIFKIKYSLSITFKVIVNNSYHNN